MLIILKFIIKNSNNLALKVIRNSKFYSLSKIFKYQNLGDILMDHILTIINDLINIMG